MLLAAVDLAREAAESIATRGTVGEHEGAVMLGERLAMHYFTCTNKGYRGWRWAIAVARAPRAKVATVCETNLLPGDDAPLAERAKALGQWCQGFLDGFGMVVGNAPLSAEAMEVLQDLSAIAQVQSGLEESEDGESDYMEVMEYLRVAPLLLFAECGKPAAPAPKPSLH